MSQLGSIKEDDATALRDQSSPRVTLVLLGEGSGERRVAIASYTDEAVANELAAINVPIQYRRCARDRHRPASVARQSSGVAAGCNYYQVNLQVTNMVTHIVDAGHFTELVDGTGNRYALSPPGLTAANASGWAKGALQPQRPSLRIRLR